MSEYSQALFDYWHGERDVAYTIHRDDGFSHVIPATASFATPPFSPLEQLALERATGRVLDVGAGVGRHALFLQNQGRRVTAIEIEPVLVSIMAERGVAEPLAGDIFSLLGRQFDTILMLMNGFGLVGTPAGADAFFKHVSNLLAPAGQILCDSLDVRRTTNTTHLAYQKANLRQNRPAGQLHLSIEYRGGRGKTFNWLHLNFEELRELSHKHNMSAEMLAQEDTGHYLARLVSNPQQRL